MESPPRKWKTVLLKSLAVHGVFAVLHFSYDWFPNRIVGLFSGTSEAVFQHMKIGFYSYGLISVIEGLLRRKKIDRMADFAFARLTSTVFYPWFMFILFYAPTAFYGKYQTNLAEIISANSVLFLNSICAILLENELERIKLSREFMWMMAILALILVSLYVIFSFQIPWFDVFAIPPGWE